MLAKLSRGNQLTIPKSLVERAGLKAGRDYVEAVYTHGTIVLKPVDVEERVPPEAYERLLEHAFKVEKGDILAEGRAAGGVLRKRLKQPR
ncbi:MAG: AbrB/MazE/SpoVT family DNA-binding domain-containing protein [Candidatus Omnitrophica bacterium]|nr:AbrB/MazE/SpoVT family DNA-binding domain-containing protein [Candidatus Omnitrophota bacterium]